MLTSDSMPYKFILTAVNIASCYWSLYKYATYFAKRHPKIVESEKAIEVVLRLQEDATTTTTPKPASSAGTSAKASIAASAGGRRMTVTALDGAAIRRMTAGSIGVGGEIARMTREGSVLEEEKEEGIEEEPPVPAARQLRMSAIGEVDVLDASASAAGDVLDSGSLETQERRRSGFREFVTIAPLVREESIEEIDEDSSGRSDSDERAVMLAPTVAVA
jgi:hypothetical protein